MNDACWGKSYLYRGLYSYQGITTEWLYCTCMALSDEELYFLVSSKVQKSYFDLCKSTYGMGCPLADCEGTISSSIDTEKIGYFNATKIAQF